MALIKCSECGKEYSNNAPACPKCGNPTEGKEVAPKQQTVVVQKKKSSAWAWIVLAIVGIGILGATGTLSNLTASYNLDVTVDDSRVNKLGVCYVKGKITNKGDSDVTECTLTFNLVKDETQEYVGKAVTKFSTIKAGETLKYEANGVCDSSVKNAKWKYDIKCGDNE